MGKDALSRVWTCGYDARLAEGAAWPGPAEEEGAAVEKKARLGRGLDALLSEMPGGEGGVGSPEVAVDAIENNPYQPRKQFDEDDLESLRESIKTHGVLQPLVVRQVGDRYQLIAGERRL